MDLTDAKARSEPHFDTAGAPCQPRQEGRGAPDRYLKV